MCIKLVHIYWTVHWDALWTKVCVIFAQSAWNIGLLTKQFWSVPGLILVLIPPWGTLTGSGVYGCEGLTIFACFCSRYGQSLSRCRCCHHLLVVKFIHNIILYIFLYFNLTYVGRHIISRIQTFWVTKIETFCQSFRKKKLSDKNWTESCCD